ncbi:unnamed protein product [Periconia digitata]|uniref:Rhodopsin domain-containing protein n=1 Tax=Periconia digitata TaxID=1303443 RepID=A0A9W4XM74_9PLEO|nr:unnamed protein product [Periconia digitata]
MDDLSQIPVIPPPPGSVSDFANPPTLMTGVIAGTAIIQAVVLPFLLTRIIVNAMTRRFRLEDALCYLAYLAMIAQATLVVYASAIGGARHAWDISLLTLGTVMRYYNYILSCWTLSAYFGRIFILLQFKRLFTAKDKKGSVYWIIVGSIIGNTALYFAFLMSYTFECYPREKIWNPTVEGRCVATTKLQLATGILRFCCAIGIACVGLWLRIETARALDFTWPLTQLAIVCQAELASIIVVGCTPFIPRLFHWKPLRGRSGYAPQSPAAGYSDRMSKGQKSGSGTDADAEVPATDGENARSPAGVVGQRFYANPAEAPVQEGENRKEAAGLAGHRYHAAQKKEGVKSEAQGAA